MKGRICGAPSQLVVKARHLILMLEVTGVDLRAIGRGLDPTD